jgi:hypothetical protein
MDKIKNVTELTEDNIWKLIEENYQNINIFVDWETDQEAKKQLKDKIPRLYILVYRNKEDIIKVGDDKIEFDGSVKIDKNYNITLLQRGPKTKESEEYVEKIVFSGHLENGGSLDVYIVGEQKDYHNDFNY